MQACQSPCRSTTLILWTTQQRLWCWSHRLLHGRTSFDPAEGLRHLQGCYIDIDGPRSLYRVLRRGAAA